MSQLSRITTEYVDSEDRIRLCGAIQAPNGPKQGHEQVTVLWLTQRLLNRLVPHLLTWLAQQAGVTGGIGSDVRADVVHSFAQQAAMASMEMQAPVQVQSAQSVWLVQSVDVTVNPQLVRLTFKGSATGQQGADLDASVSMQALPLRQWLSILHDQCRRAGWVSPEASSAVWPEWLQTRQQDVSGGVVLH